MIGLAPLRRHRAVDHDRPVRVRGLARPLDHHRSTGPLLGAEHVEEAPRNGTVLVALRDHHHLDGQEVVARRIADLDCRQDLVRAPEHGHSTAVLVDRSCLAFRKWVVLRDAYADGVLGEFVFLLCGNFYDF